jgi:hypothetical protein
MTTRIIFLVLMCLSAAAHAQTKVTDVLLFSTTPGQCTTAGCTIVGGLGSNGRPVATIVVVGQNPFSGSLQLTAGSQFVINGTQLYVGGHDISPGTYPITIRINY